ncbi:MAG: hypothetical protein ACI9LY_002930, partial [Arenicella sp.]
RNKMIAVTRAGGERPFATDKRHYGSARTRYRTRQVQDSCVKNMKYWQKRQHNQATTLL